MARKPSMRDEGQPAETSGYTDIEAGRTQLPGRRSFLRASALTVAGLAAGGVATGSVAADDDEDEDSEGEAYETITVDSGTHETIDIGDGETFENVLIDITEAGSGVTINAANATEWTIRNVAVRGESDIGDGAVIGAGDVGGNTSRIENVWLGDGAVYEQKGSTGVWANPEHSGHLEIERVNVQEMGDNAFYVSAPGASGGGTVSFENCYAANCWVAQYRLAEGVVKNCVASVTDDREHRQGRGLWAWAPGTTEVTDSHFDMNGHHYAVQAGANGNAGDVELTDTEVDDGFEDGYATPFDSSVEFGEGTGNDPEDFVPDGCPETLEDVFEEIDDE